MKHRDTPERQAQLERIWKTTWFGMIAQKHAQGLADRELMEQTKSNMTQLQLKEFMVECDALKDWLRRCLE